LAAVRGIGDAPTPAMKTLESIESCQLQQIQGGLERGLHAWWFPTEEKARTFVNAQGFAKANVFRSTYPKQPWFVNVDIP
jgi:hypothetical protein